MVHGAGNVHGCVRRTDRDHEFGTIHPRRQRLDPRQAGVACPLGGLGTATGADPGRAMAARDQRRTDRCAHRARMQEQDVHLR